MTPVATLTQHAIAIRDSKPIDDRVTITVRETSTLRVTDAASYALAGEHLQGIAALKKEIVAYFKDDKARSYALWKSQCKKEGDALCTIDDQETRLRHERKTWKAEQDRLQREAEQAAAIEAQKVEQARLLAEAALAEQRHQPELAAAIVVEAIATPAPVVVLPSAVPKDLPQRKEWKWRLKPGCTDADVSRDFLMLDTKKLSAYAKAMKATARVEGIEFYEEDIDIVRVSSVAHHPV